MINDSFVRVRNCIFFLYMDLSPDNEDHFAKLKRWKDSLDVSA